jgi:hypothetical protein
MLSGAIAFHTLKEKIHFGTFVKNKIINPSLRTYKCITFHISPPKRLVDERIVLGNKLKDEPVT